MNTKTRSGGSVIITAFVTTEYRAWAGRLAHHALASRSEAIGRGLAMLAEATGVYRADARPQAKRGGER